MKRLQLDGDTRNDRSERKRKSRFGDEEDIIPEKTLVPMVCLTRNMCAMISVINIYLFIYTLYCTNIQIINYYLFID